MNEFWKEKNDKGNLSRLPKTYDSLKSSVKLRVWNWL